MYRVASTATLRTTTNGCSRAQRLPSGLIYPVCVSWVLVRSFANPANPEIGCQRRLQQTKTLGSFPISPVVFTVLLTSLRVEDSRGEDEEVVRQGLSGCEGHRRLVGVDLARFALLDGSFLKGYDNRVKGA